MQEDAIECVRMAISSIGLCFFFSLCWSSMNNTCILCNCKEYCFCNYSRITLVEKLTCTQRNTRTLPLYLVVTVYRILEYSQRFFFWCTFLHFISFTFFGEFMFANNNCISVNSSFLIGASNTVFFVAFLTLF